MAAGCALVPTMGMLVPCSAVCHVHPYARGGGGACWHLACTQSCPSRPLSLCALCRFELHIQAVHLLDYFGGMALICPDDYWAVQPQPSWAAATVAV